MTFDPLLLLGTILLGNLLSGIVGFAIGRVTKRGPDRVIDIYKPQHENDIPF